MPWKIEENHPGCSTDEPWGVVKEADGALEGCHATEDSAKKQQAALYAAEERSVRMEIKDFVARFIEALRREFGLERAWDGSASNYDSTDAYCSACLIDLNSAAGRDTKAQSHCMLPVKSPGSDSYNFEGIQAAAGGRGITRVEKPDDVPQEDWDSAVKSAANTIISQYSANDKTAPASVYEAAGKEPPDEARAIAMRNVYDQVWNAVNERDSLDGIWTWVNDIYMDGAETYAIVTRSGKLYRIPLEISDAGVTLGEWQEVMEAHEPVATRTVVREQGDGRFRWFSVSCTSVLNRQSEIDSRDLFDSFIAHAEETGSYPVRDFYHLREQFRTGQADFLARDGNVYITSGLYDDTELARREIAARQADPDAWGDSIMYKPLGEPEMVEIAEDVRVPVYRSGINTFISTLPEAQAASLFTVSQVQEVSRMLEGKILTAFVDLFNGDEDEARRWLTENVDETNRAIAEGGLIARSTGDGEEPPNDVQDVEVEMTPDDLAEIVRMVEESETVVNLGQSVTDLVESVRVLREEVTALIEGHAGRLEALEADDGTRLERQVQDMGRSHKRKLRVVRPRQARARDDSDDDEEPAPSANEIAAQIMKEKKIVGG